MTSLSGLLAAFGLSTASGLNAFIPLLTIGIVARFTDWITLGAPYDVLEHPALLITIGVLLALDLIGDKVPVVDHALHTVGVVVAPTAGAIAFLAANSSAGLVHPVVAVICGVLAAGLAHGTRAAARPIVTATTGGVGNPVISLLENLAALLLTILAFVAPVVAAVAVVLLLILAIVVFRRVRAIWRARAAAAQ
ncbi:MAG: DUF4126 family protein [Chloroflexi bacterium]|nr:DUF4126 family protein [Chloroflexota bacterium]